MMARQDVNARPWEWPLLRHTVTGLLLEWTLAALVLLHGKWEWLVLASSAALVAGWTWWTQSLKKRRADGPSEPEAGEP